MEINLLVLFFLCILSKYVELMLPCTHIQCPCAWQLSVSVPSAIPGCHMYLYLSAACICIWLPPVSLYGCQLYLQLAASCLCTCQPPVSVFGGNLSLLAATCLAAICLCIGCNLSLYLATTCLFTWQPPVSVLGCHLSLYREGLPTFSVPCAHLSLYLAVIYICVWLVPFSL